jgi:Alternative splicing regulator
MRLGKRQRVEDLPFAGLHDVSADPETASFVVYGVAATLHPLDQSAFDDEGAELVPWPEDSPDPVLVDRFDCRLLLEPSDLIDASASGKARQRRRETAPSTEANEAELEEQRWGDYFNPPRHQQHHRYYHYVEDDDEEEEELRKRTHGAAIPFTYLNADDGIAEVDHENKERVYYLEDLEPPPPPPYLSLLENHADTSLISILKSAGGGGSSNDNSSGTSSKNYNCAPFLPFTARQYAIMERTADFLRLYKDQGGTEILYKRAFNDPTFAFLSPDHIWNNFFKGLLVENGENLNEKAEKARANGGQEGVEEVKLEEEILLGALLGGYASEEEKEKEEEEVKEEIKTEKRPGSSQENMESVVKAIIARLMQSTTPNTTAITESSSTSQNMARIVKERLSTDPLVASIINPGAPFYNLFHNAVQGAVVAGEMDNNTAAIWLGQYPANMDSMNAAVNNKEEETEPAALSSAPAAPATAAPATVAPAALAEKKVRKIRKATTAPPDDDVDTTKKEERKKKARLLLERQRQVAEERRQGQAIAQKQAEEARNQHLAAISVHKRMFLDNSDDE